MQTPTKYIIQLQWYIETKSSLEQVFIIILNYYNFTSMYIKKRNRYLFKTPTLGIWTM